jgi:hypothetical protein
MNKIIKIIIILSLFAHFCKAQTVNSLDECNKNELNGNVTTVIKTVEEYEVFFKAIVLRIKLAEKDTSNWIGIPVSELVKRLDKYDLKIVQVSFPYYDREKLYPQHVYGIYLQFTTYETSVFTHIHKLTEPAIGILFTESKSYEKALSLFREHKGYFTKEVEEFYSDAIIKYIVEVYIPDDIYPPHIKRNNR